MCILYKYHGTNDAESDYSFILISNREEYYGRPTENIGPWAEDHRVYGGRDLQANDGGTWLAVSPNRKKLGALLSLMGPNNPDTNGKGKIVADYVKSEKPATAYIEQTKNYSKDCNGFVFVSVEFRNTSPTISSYSNVTNELLTHKDTYVGFSNSLPKEPLKKVEVGKIKFKEIVTTYNKVYMYQNLVDKLIELLKSDESHLPDRELELKRPNLFKELSSIFVCIPKEGFGTRTHTIVIVTKTGQMDVIEHTQEAPIDPLCPKWIKTEFQFDIESTERLI